MRYSFAPLEDKKTWNAFVLTHSPEALFQSWEWGEVQTRIGVPVQRIGMYDGSTLVGVAQVTTIRAKRGTFLQVRHGPVVSKQTATVFSSVLGEVKRLATREGALFVRCNPLLVRSEKHNALLTSLGGVPAAIHAMDAELCWVLDLTPQEEDILAAMRKTTRYEIKRAQKLGVHISSTENEADLHKFFALYDETAKRHGFVGHGGIKEEFSVFVTEKQAILYIAEHEGTVLASALMLFWGDQCIYHHGASTPSKIPASYLLQWEAIREAKKRGKKVYNFWGIAPENAPSHPWRGISLFKQGFGGRPVEYIHAHDIPLSPLYVIPRTIEQIRKWRKGY